MKVSAVTCHPSALSACCQRDPLRYRQKADCSDAQRLDELRSLFGCDPPLRGTSRISVRRVGGIERLALHAGASFKRDVPSAVARTSADLFLADLARHGEHIRRRLPRILMERFMRQHLAFSCSCRN